MRKSNWALDFVALLLAATAALFCLTYCNAPSEIVPPPAEPPRVQSGCPPQVGGCWEASGNFGECLSCALCQYGQDFDCCTDRGGDRGECHAYANIGFNLNFHNCFLTHRAPPGTTTPGDPRRSVLDDPDMVGKSSYPLIDEICDPESPHYDPQKCDEEKAEDPPGE